MRPQPLDNLSDITLFRIEAGGLTFKVMLFLANQYTSHSTWSGFGFAVLFNRSSYPKYRDFVAQIPRYFRAVPKSKDPNLSETSRASLFS
jgi:hypothetical protein